MSDPELQHRRTMSKFRSMLAAVVEEAMDEAAHYVRMEMTSTPGEKEHLATLRREAKGLKQRYEQELIRMYEEAIQKDEEK